MKATPHRLRVLAVAQRAARYRAHVEAAAALEATGRLDAAGARLTSATNVEREALASWRKARAAERFDAASDAGLAGFHGYAAQALLESSRLRDDAQERLDQKHEGLRACIGERDVLGAAAERIRVEQRREATRRMQRDADELWSVLGEGVDL